MNDDFVSRMKEYPKLPKQDLPDEKEIEKEKEIVNSFLERAKNNDLLNKRHIKFVNGPTHSFYKTMAILLIIILAAGVVGFLYLLDKGNLQSICSLACGNVSLKCADPVPCPSCPVCPTAPACPSCPSCSPSLHCGNST
jgi:hypothetical protein